MLKLKSKRTEQKQAAISAHEAFSLWDVLCYKYDNIEKLGMHECLAHDIDLRLIINRVIKTVTQHKENLEKLMMEYGVQPPDQWRIPSDWSGNPEIVRDEFIARGLLTDMGAHLENLLKWVKIVT